MNMFFSYSSLSHADICHLALFASFPGEEVGRGLPSLSRQAMGAFPIRAGELSCVSLCCLETMLKGFAANLQTQSVCLVVATLTGLGRDAVRCGDLALAGDETASTSYWLIGHKTVIRLLVCLRKEGRKESREKAGLLLASHCCSRCDSQSATILTFKYHLYDAE